MLSGSLAGIGLGGQTDGNLLSLNGVHAQSQLAGTARAASEGHTDANPLSVSVLDAINVELTGISQGTLSSLLTFLTDESVGAVNQYAYANSKVNGSNTAEIGGAGAVSDNGTLDLSVSDGSSQPSLAQLNLRNVLLQLTGMQNVTDLLATVGDLTLDIGALGGRATMDSDIVGADPASVVREYVIAHLKLDVESDLVGDVLEALPSTLGAPDSLLGAVGDLLSGVLGLLVNTTIDIRINLDQLTDALPEEEDAILRLHLSEGRATVNLAELLGSGFDGTGAQWLNTRPANTRLFSEGASLPNNVLSDQLPVLTSAILDRLKDLVEIEVSIVGRLAGTQLVHIEGSLGEFLSGDSEIVLVGLNRLGDVVASLLGTVGTGVEELLTTTLEESQALDSALGAVNTLLDSVFTILRDVVAVTINAQNDTSGEMPSFYEDITPAGRYDVAALHLAVLDNVGLLNVSLGRGSVGENVARNASQNSRQPQSL